MPEDDLYKDIRIAVVGLYCGGRIDEPDFDDPLNCRHLDDFFSDLVAGKANINLRRALDLEAIVTNLGADGRSVLLIVSSAKDADDSRFMELSESGKLHYCRSTEDAIMQAQSELLASARDLVLVSHLPDDASEPVFAIALARYADGLASPVYAILSGAGFQSTALSSVERLHSGESEQSVSFGSLSSNSDVAIALFAGQLEGDGGICCGLRKLSKSDSIASLFETVCSLHAKILIGGEHVEQMLSNSRLFCLETIRPWIHPVYQESRPRRAALILDCIETDSFFVLALAEADGATTAVAPSFRLPWASEVVLFSGESQEELLENVKLIESLIELYPGIDLASLAYTLSCFFEPEINSWRLSLVASSMDALSGKLQVVSEKLVSGVDYLADQKDGIFLTSPDTAKQGDLAFLLPGLGSAYTNMLSDLCMHFSQVREVFDFVDRVTEKLGASEAPSLRIFPVLVESDRTNANPVASLASADYAVVAVLMTEHAIFNLLGRIGIIPDVLLGFSTGEFGVYTMNGCIDVVEAAPLFYHLSTSAARSIDEKKVESLRTVSVFTDRKSVMDLVERLNLEIFLTVDLAAGHVIVTGEKAQVLRLLEELSDAEINYHVLPLSIPYHTNLVEGVLADN
ncbi:MAG: hypothetical protein K8F91_05440, partial [Candidatus Obscuribacterales bacterium]|nr:hypothetical protein [Candidatus Obscuribacterales bacterium]